MQVLLKCPKNHIAAIIVERKLSGKASAVKIIKSSLSWKKGRFSGFFKEKKMALEYAGGEK